MKSYEDRHIGHVPLTLFYVNTLSIVFTDTLQIGHCFILDCAQLQRSQRQRCLHGSKTTSLGFSRHIQQQLSSGNDPLPPLALLLLLLLLRVGDLDSLFDSDLATSKGCVDADADAGSCSCSCGCVAFAVLLK